MHIECSGAFTPTRSGAITATIKVWQPVLANLMSRRIGTKTAQKQISAAKIQSLADWFYCAQLPGLALSNSARSSRQWAYCSTLCGSGSSCPLSQKQNQSRVPSSETNRSQGFTKICVPSGR